MENLTLEECQTYLRKLQEISICIVCHGPLRSNDIAVCVKGHAVCISCKKANSNCGLCRSGYSQDSHITLSQMVEAMPKFCRYNYSCSHYLHNNDDHESWCKFRPVICLFCNQTVEYHVFLTHLSNVHNYEPTNMSDIDLKVLEFVNGQNLINTTLLKMRGNHIFKIYYLYMPREKSIQVNILFFPHRSVTDTNFKISLDISSVDGKVSCRLFKIVKLIPNEKNIVFSLSDPLMETFNHKDINFKTTIFKCKN